MDPDLLERVCTRHQKMGEQAAKRNAEARRESGDPVSAFRCPFCLEWHVGHGPSLTTMQEVALALRERRGNRPKEREEHELAT